MNLQTLRETQIKNGKIRGIVEECIRNDVTLNDLRLYWQTEYTSNRDALNRSRTRTRLKKNAKKANAARWQKQRDFLAGDIHSEAVKEEMSEAIENPFSPSDIEKDTSVGEIFES
jgi:hypothetical protein